MNDGNRTAFAASLQRMVSTPFHDNEPSANCNENQVVERTGRTFVENSVCVLSTGGDVLQGTIVLGANWSNYFWNVRSLKSDGAPKRRCISMSRGPRGLLLGQGLGRWCPWLQVEGLCHQVKELQEEGSRLHSIRDD